MKKILLGMACALSLVATEVDLNTPLPLEESLEISANAMNKSLPTMIDAELRHDKVEAHGLNLTFKFTLVNFTRVEMDAKRLKGMMEADIKKQVCTDVDSQMMLKKGMKIVYDYVDRNKKNITQFSYDAKTCGLMSHGKNIKQNIVHRMKNKTI